MKARDDGEDATYTISSSSSQIPGHSQTRIIGKDWEMAPFLNVPSFLSNRVASCGSKWILLLRNFLIN